MSTTKVVVETTTTAGTTTTAAPAPVYKRVWAGVGFLRDAPSVDGNKVMKVGENDNARLLDATPRSGWYNVEIGGTSGWIYGGLMTPPDPGHCVLEIDDRRWNADATRLIGTVHGDYVAIIPPRPGGNTDSVWLSDAKDYVCS